MAERIELPPMLQGDENAQLQQLWSYLYQMSEALNNNLQAIGGNELTDSDRQVMNKILGEAGEKAVASGEMETLKSLIIKTADFVQTNLQEYRLNLLGESVASGQFGRYVRHTGLDVAVTPEGIMQNYSFEEVVKGLKEFSINAKNYIKTGLLRTVGGIPVYGVAIGKDVVTFSEDGTETYNDGNKVAELTAEELSFWQNSVKIAGYTGSRISFYYNGNEVFYIQQGKLYAVGDIEITSGKKLILASGGGLDVNSGGNVTVKSGGNLNVESGGQIDINASGNLKLSGSDVEINGGRFFVNSANFVLDGFNRSLKTGNWELKWGGIFYNDTITIADRNFRYLISENDYCKSINSADSYTVQLYLHNHRDGYFGISNWELTGEAAFICYNPATDLRADFPIFLQPHHNRVLVGNNPDWHIGGYKGYSTIYYGDKFLVPYSDHTGTQVGSSSIPFAYGYFDSITYTTLIQNSSKEIKHDIQKMESYGEALDELKPVSFVYDSDPNEQRRLGLIYEDTVEVMPEICTKDESNKAINYVELIPVLLKEIQELRARVKALEERGENQ